jgi:hypothetical protein
VAAVLGAVFAMQVGTRVSDGGVGLDPALRNDVIDGVQSVFRVAAPLGGLALILVLRLPEAPLRTPAAGRGEATTAGPWGDRLGGGFQIMKEERGRPTRRRFDEGSNPSAPLLTGRVPPDAAVTRPLRVLD